MNRIPISKGLRFRIFMRDHFTCRYCAKRGDGVRIEVDHILPVARGGRNFEDNLVTACSDCNSGKRARLLDVPAPWNPKPQFTPKSRGSVFRVGTEHWEAQDDRPHSYDGAVEELWARVRLLTRKYDEDGQEWPDPPDRFDFTIWRPAENPHAFNELEPHAVYIFDLRDDEEPYHVVYADRLERDARKLFDALPHHDGWSYWRGGHSPLPQHICDWSDCEYLYRNGRTGNTPLNWDHPWKHYGPLGWDGQGDIIAYRVLKTEARKRKDSDDLGWQLGAEVQP